MKWEKREKRFFVIINLRQKKKKEGKKASFHFDIIYSNFQKCFTITFKFIPSIEFNDKHEMNVTLFNFSIFPPFPPAF